MQTTEEDFVQQIEFTESQQKLANAVLTVAGVAVKKGHLQYTSWIKIDVQKDKIEFTTTDTEVLIAYNVESCGIKKSGSVLVDALKFCEIIKKMPSDTNITVVSCGNNVKIASDRIDFFLPALDSKDFPVISDTKEKFSIDFDCSDLKFLLEGVKFAASTESSRQSLNGVYIEFGQNCITSAATDIHRLAVAELKKNAEHSYCFILQKKTVNEVLKVVGMCKSIAVVMCGEQHVTKIKFCSDQIKIVSKLIAGTFPAFKNAIPKDLKFYAVLDKKDLKRSIERVTTVLYEQSKAIRLGIKKDRLQLEVTSSDSSFAKEAISIKSNIEEEIQIHFNYTYLLDAISVLNGKQIKMMFNGPSSQVILCDPENKGLTNVVMPMMN